MVKSGFSNQISYRQNHGFTLIELLVVVAIIAVLVAVLIPALSLARAQAQTSVCASQLHQLGLGVIYYAKECNGIVPFCDGVSVEEWRKDSPFMTDFQKFSGLERKMFYCPTNSRSKRIDHYWEETWQLYIGYCYIANRDLKNNCCGWWPPDEKPIINLDKDSPDGWTPAQRLLFTDLITTDYLGITPDEFPSGGYKSHPPDSYISHLVLGEKSHVYGNFPRGGNHLYGDGHVQWWSISMLELHPVWGMTYVPMYHQLWNP
jgi:prepilin-type N-terminal cleavage/methylation domain-containing protein